MKLVTYCRSEWDMASLNIFLLVLFSFMSFCSCERTWIYVSAERGNDSHCYLADPKIPCHTLERAAVLVREYNLGTVSISINSNIEITSVIRFENVNGIHLIGTSDATRITCSDSSVSGTGLAFASVYDLVMENIEFYNCSGKGNESASIYIQECSNVKLNNITVRFSKMLGLTFFNTSGEILIQNSQFIDNGVSDVKDQFNTVVQELFRISSKELRPNYTYKNTGASQSGRLEFRTLGFRESERSSNASLHSCPPGFLSYGGEECVCAADNYTGIEFCSRTKLQAYVERGYWIGYVTDVGEFLPEYLFTAPCPLGFCSYINCTKKDACILPNTPDSMNKFICGDNRMGILCGECSSKRTVYYHSRQYQCGETEMCHFGLLFYVLSEIVPLTILFTTVVVLDFRFTSGTANGFIFFSQVLDSLSVDAKGIIQFPHSIDKLSIGYKIIYGLFNFDFFNIESLSFCLWKQATVLDILAFKYVTTILALGLVIILVCIIKCCHCEQVCALRQKISTRNSVIHGLSAILVICYAQCTKVSFQILTPVTLTGLNGTTLPAITFYGGIPYFGRKHLLYAIPACMCIATLVAIPPLLLLVFPLYFQILAFCGLSESRAANWASRRIWTVRLKPVLDSFQGCFKGKLRFFAGIYFAYRITILAVGTFFKITLELYISVSVVLVLMLTLHAVAQPYEKRQYNIIDSLIFSNLVIINGCTLYAYKNQADSSKQSISNALLWIQLILIYLPLVHICALLAKRFVLKARNHLKKKKEGAAEEQLTPQHEDTEYHFIDHELLPYQEFGFSGTESQETSNNRF